MMFRNLFPRRTGDAVVRTDLAAAVYENSTLQPNIQKVNVSALISSVTQEVVTTTAPNVPERQAMIKRHEIGTIENEVLFGEDDILFLAGGAHAVLEIVTGQQPISERSYKAFSENITSRQSWANCNNALYLHVIFPDKQSVIPESWPLGTPIKLGERYIDRCRDMNLPIFYPAELLSQHKSDAITRNDTHITDYGSILVAANIVQRLTGESQKVMLDNLMKTLDVVEERMGDLGAKLQPPESALFRVSSAIAPGAWLHNNLQGGNNGLVDLRFCRNPVYNKRLLMFGDSFGREVARYLQFWFREVVFLRSGYFHSEVAQMLRPEIIITENVERYLDSCSSDEERPSFFMYPSLSGVPYCPSPEFARAFSALLSTPRPPYIKVAREYLGESFISSELASVRRVSAAFQNGCLRLLDSGSMWEEVYEIEQVEVIERHMPDFRLNLSGRDYPEWLAPLQDIHSSNLVSRRNVLLIGPNLLVDEEGHWACESRAFKQQFLDLARSTSFQVSFPGSKPEIFYDGLVNSLNFDELDTSDIEHLSEPVFLATPLEPANWGRWIVTALPKLVQFRKYGSGRKLLCYSSLSWQGALLARFGIAESEIINHDPGRTYYCNDVMTVDYNVANITISRMERALFADIRSDSIARLTAIGKENPSHERVYVSRLGMAARHPNYRVLTNESELAEKLVALSFKVLQPETLSFDQQVAIFACARVIVCLGGAALYNTVFCKAGTKVIILESSDNFLSPHCNLLSSLGLDYGVIIGTQDETDLTPIHKRWSINTTAVCEQIRLFV